MCTNHLPAVILSQMKNHFYMRAHPRRPWRFVGRVEESRRPSGSGFPGLRYRSGGLFHSTSGRRLLPSSRPFVPFHKPPSPSNPLRAAAPWLAAHPFWCSAIPEALAWSWLRFGELTMASFHFASARPPPLHQTQAKASSMAPHLVNPRPPHKPNLAASAAPVAPRRFSSRTRPPFGRPFSHPSKTPLRSIPQPIPPAAPRTIPAGGNT